MDDPNTRNDRDKAAASRAANALEIACVNSIQPTESGCEYTFTRTFEHLDWVDFESLVQAGATPEESGINDRFHRIEADLDALGDNVRRAFSCLETLRAQLRVCLNEIVTAINAKPTPNKDKEQTKDTKDTKDSKESKDTKETKETKDNKENKESRDAKTSRDNKNTKDNKEAREKEQKERTKESLGAIEKKDQDGPGRVRDLMDFADPLTGGEWPTLTPPLRGDQRVFITPDERPALGERALNEPRME